MACRGIIVRNGITTPVEAACANACQITLAFSYDTCVFLSALGLLAGEGIAAGAYSTGCTDSRVSNALGLAVGISKRSISRQDANFGKFPPTTQALSSY
jgi:hypothetical protein